MGVTENEATLLDLNCLDVLPRSVDSVDGVEIGLSGSGRRVAVLATFAARR
jgi:hypothetical protein